MLTIQLQGFVISVAIIGQEDLLDLLLRELEKLVRVDPLSLERLQGSRTGGVSGVSGVGGSVPVDVAFGCFCVVVLKGCEVLGDLGGEEGRCTSMVVGYGRFEN